MVTASAQTGDAHSFERPMKWRGAFVNDTSVTLRADCSQAPAGQRCVQLQPAPASTQFDEANLETIVLPANSGSARSLLCQVVSPYIEYQVFNPDPQFLMEAHAFVSARLRVESAVLADPNLINPVTGEPFGGFLDETLPGGHNFYKPLGALKGESVFDADRSRFCVGGIVSKARLIDFYGLTAAQATAFFAGEITLRLGIRGNVKLVSEAAYFRFNVRFLSD
jgi:hypothetical protein